MRQLLLLLEIDDEHDADEQHDADDHDEKAQDETGLLALGALAVASAEPYASVALALMPGLGRAARPRS